MGRPALAEVVSLDAHRRTPRPGILAEATTAGEVRITIQRSTGEQLCIDMAPEQAARFALQLTDAVDLAEVLARG